MMEKFTQDAIQITEQLLNKTVRGVDYPGGSKRRSIRLFLNDQSSIIATHRKNKKIAEKEIAILKLLRTKKAKVPAILAHQDQWCLQEDLGKIRLSEKLYQQPQQIELLLSNAIDSILWNQKIATHCKLPKTVTQISQYSPWLTKQIGRPNQLSKRLNINPPKINEKKLFDLLTIQNPCFVKWDCRPGNAIVKNDNSVFWFDWEDCCIHNSVDDLIWLLGDEYVPNDFILQQQLLEKYLNRFSQDVPIAITKDYFFHLGCLHLCTRIHNIVRYVMHKQSWVDQQICYAGDKVLATPEGIERLLTRLKHWSQQTRHLTSLQQWVIDNEQSFYDAPTLSLT